MDAMIWLALDSTAGYDSICCCADAPGWVESICTVLDKYNLDKLCNSLLVL